MSETNLLEVQSLYKSFRVKKDSFFGKPLTLKAVNDVSLYLKAGETLGIVGESGCGKSTLAKTIARLYEANSGNVFFKGKELTKLSQKELRPIRPKVQYVFQDPYESLNPRHTIGSILEEPFVIHTKLNHEERKQKALELLAKVGLSDTAYNKYPHEFSGGQRQRIGIARAIALDPELLICDEPVSALDVSVQSQIINLLIQLQKEMNIAILFIAHDLAVVKHISDRINVMYLGSIVESASSEELFKNPVHPYTQFLLDAIPTTTPKNKTRKRIRGELPSPIHPPAGCLFHTRCPLATEQCLQSRPQLTNLDNDAHYCACHLSYESAAQWDPIWD